MLPYTPPDRGRGRLAVGSNTHYDVPFDRDTDVVACGKPSLTRLGVPGGSVVAEHFPHASRNNYIVRSCATVCMRVIVREVTDLVFSRASRRATTSKRYRGPPPKQGETSGLIP